MAEGLYIVALRGEKVTRFTARMRKARRRKMEESNIPSASSLILWESAPVHDDNIAKLYT